MTVTPDVKRRRLAIEAGFVLAVLIAGYALGSRYHQAFRASGEKEDFGQYTFAAAVSLACGQGFSDIGTDGIAAVMPPELNLFLTLKQDTFDCRSLPPRIPRVEPNLTQGLYRYLMGTVAAVWMVKGLSWSGLSPLFGVAYALTLAAAYGLFRLGMGRVIALLMTTVLAVSAVHLGYLPYLRDYAKAPFILGLILIMALIAREPFERRRALALSAAFGVVLGIGFGFRNDLLINIGPWVAVVLLCTPGRWRDRLALKAACLVTSATVFAIVAAPILSAYGRGSNTGHVALLGVMTPFDAPLGVAGSVYEWGYGYSDSLTAVIISSFTERVHAERVVYLSAEYDAAAVEIFLKIVRQWPADMVTRAYGSVLQILELPFQIGVSMNALPQGLSSPGWLRVYTWQQGLLKLFAGSGPYLVSAALILIATISLRAAVTLLLFALYFLGYPAIQFHIRHFFHLEFIAWWALGFLAQYIVDAVRKPLPRNEWASELRSRVPRAAGFAAAAALLILGPIAVLRAYQEREVTALIADRYVAAAREPLVTAPQAVGDDRTLLALPTVWQGRDTSKPVDVAYVVAEFSSAGCPVGRLSATFRSTASPEDFRYVIEVKVLPGGAPTLVFFPGYRADNFAEFLGIELQNAEVGCLARVSRVAAAQVPDLLVGLNLTPEWRSATLYQTIKDFETADDGAGPVATHVSYPLKLRWPRVDALEPLVLHDQVLSEATLVRPEGAGWHIQGRPPSAYGYLVWFQTTTVPAGSTFVVDGDLRRGALTVGLLKDNRWAGTVNVVSRGPFVASVAVPAAGEYALVVANFSTLPWAPEYLPGLVPWLPSVLTRTSYMDAVIQKAGWIRDSRR